MTHTAYTVDCDQLRYPPAGPFSKAGLAQWTDEKLLQILHRGQLPQHQLDRVRCEAAARGLLKVGDKVDA